MNDKYKVNGETNIKDVKYRDKVISSSKFRYWMYVDKEINTLNKEIAIKNNELNLFFVLLSTTKSLPVIKYRLKASCFSFSAAVKFQIFYYGFTDS